MREWGQPVQDFSIPLILLVKENNIHETPYMYNERHFGLDHHLTLQIQKNCHFNLFFIRNQILSIIGLQALPSPTAIQGRCFNKFIFLEPCIRDYKLS